MLELGVTMKYLISLIIIVNLYGCKSSETESVQGGVNNGPQIIGTNDQDLINLTAEAQGILSRCTDCHLNGRFYGDNGAGTRWSEMWNNAEAWASIGSSKEGLSNVHPQTLGLKLIDLDEPENSLIIKISRGCEENTGQGFGRMHRSKNLNPDNLDNNDENNPCFKLQRWIEKLNDAFGAELAQNDN